MIAKRSLVVAALTLVIIGALTAYAALQAEAVRKFRHRAEVAAISSQVAQSLRRQFVVYEQVAHALQALFRASVTVEEDEFTAFVHQIVQGRREIIACGWVPATPEENVESATDRDKDGMGGETTGYWVVLEETPGARPESGEGARGLAELLRVSGSPLGRVGALATRLSPYGARTAICYCGMAQSRGGVLVQPQRGRIGVFVDLEESLRQVLDAAPSQAVEIRLELGNIVVRAGNAPRGCEWRVTPLEVVGAPARLHVASRLPDAGTGSERLWLWGFGIACSFLASAYVYLVANQHERTRQLVEQRTRELQEANRQLREEIENRLQVEEALRHARQKAEDAASAKGEFITRVSHEIRTPVQTIASVVELLRRSGLSRQEQGHLRLLESACQALLDLVDNVLNYARIETGTIEVRPTVLALREQLTDWVRLFAVRARERGLELLLDFDPAVPAAAEVDATLLRQIVVNLVSNAVKYTERGHVRVEVRGEGDRDDGGAIVLVIEDTGPGISDEQRDEIFKPFVRLAREQDGQEPGTGLGLAIVKRSVDALGGSIFVAPVQPHGTRFTVRVPCKHIACSRYIAAPPWRAKVQRVLLSCQSEGWREQLRRWFERWNCRVTTNPNDPAGWDLVVLEFSGDAPPDSSGAEWLVSSGKPVVILADPLSSQPRAPGALSQVCWLTKPVSPDELSLAIDSAVWPGVGQVQPPPGAGRHAPLDILLVEDSDVNRVLLETVLRHEGHRVRAVACLREAFDLVREDLFDLVLLDIELPDGSGLELARELRKLEQREPRRRAAIIAISGHAGAEHQRRCAEAGVDVCLCKPVTPDSIFSAVRRILGTPRSGHQGASEPRASRETGARVMLRQVNLDVAFRNVGGDWGLYKRVLTACATEVPALMELVERALQERRPSKARAALHTLRGALRTVGATGVQEDLRIAEGLAANEDLEGLASTWERIRPAITEFLTNDVPALRSLTGRELDRLVRSGATLRTVFRPAARGGSEADNGSR